MHALRKALGWLSVTYAAVFFTAALLHTGTTLGPLRQPVIAPAVIVETLCGAALLAGAYGALAATTWAWDGLIYTHAGALAGVLMGIMAVGLGPGGAAANPLLIWYHGTIAAFLTAGLGAAFYVSRVR
ncbi:hypothetical protein [Nonomuraea sp. SYSU D8015]|uniref:hypothetical protein n=1 Tax=Nonomuraea sp. SYSU D8015 TaxID=2593644 RepID=UPI001660FC28|nr:hypothetical protein [Nonomuraea sp. SYSU D8015]